MYKKYPSIMPNIFKTVHIFSNLSIYLLVKIYRIPLNTAIILEKNTS